MKGETRKEMKEREKLTIYITCGKERQEGAGAGGAGGGGEEEGRMRQKEEIRG